MYRSVDYLCWSCYPCNCKSKYRLNAVFISTYSLIFVENLSKLQVMIKKIPTIR